MSCNLFSYQGKIGAGEEYFSGKNVDDVSD